MRLIKLLNTVLVVVFAMLYGCQGGGSAEHSAVLRVELSNSEGETLFLEDINGPAAYGIDTAVIDNGKAVLEVEGVTGICRLRTAGQSGFSAILYLDGTSDLEFSGDIRKPKDYRVSGNQENEFLKEALVRQDEYVSRANDYVKVLRAPGSAAELDSVRALYNELAEASTSDMKEYINRSRDLDPELTAFLLNLLDPRSERTFIAATLTELSKEDPDSKLIQYMSGRFTQQPQQPRHSGIAIGEQAPDIMLEDPNGDPIALSSLRGSYVLIDFWASWCRPCRFENPNVVRTYHRFKDRGFDIYSVSLDKNRDRWIKAISDDGLVWNSHVSDLKGWSNQAARDYGVSSIPATFLVDQEGKVIARNLRGGALENKLNEIFSVN